MPHGDTLAPQRMKPVGFRYRNAENTAHNKPDARDDLQPRVIRDVGLKKMKRLTPILACLIVAGCNGCLGPRVQRPHSDVPVIHRIGWWAYQDGLTVTNFSVEVVDAPLHLFNSKALVRMNIAGTVRFKNGGWRPSIRKVHIGERFDPSNTNTVPVADFLVTPVIDVKEDKRYTGVPIPFILKVETHFQTFGWGQNPYRIVCGSFTNETVLTQMK